MIIPNSIKMKVAASFLTVAGVGSVSGTFSYLTSMATLPAKLGSIGRHDRRYNMKRRNNNWFDQGFLVASACDALCMVECILLLLFGVYWICIGQDMLSRYEWALSTFP